VLSDSRCFETSLQILKRLLHERGYNIVRDPIKSLFFPSNGITSFLWAYFVCHYLFETTMTVYKIEFLKAPRACEAVQHFNLKIRR